MAFTQERDDCSTENSPCFAKWIRKSLKTDPAQRGGLTDVRVKGYVGNPRGGSATTLYPVRFSYVHTPASGSRSAQEYSWAYNVQQDHDDDEPFVPTEHVTYQLSSLQRDLDRGTTSARIEGTGLETVLVVSKK